MATVTDFLPKDTSVLVQLWFFIVDYLQVTLLLAICMTICQWPKSKIDTKICSHLTELMTLMSLDHMTTLSILELVWATRPITASRITPDMATLKIQGNLIALIS
jgi:hypothetical protein